MNKDFNLKFKLPFYPETFIIEKCLNLRQALKFRHITLTLRKLIRRKHLLNFLLGRVTNGILNNSSLNALVYQRFLSKRTRPNLNFITKQNSFGIQTMLKFGLKNNKFDTINKYKRELPSSLLYVMTRIEEKKDSLVLNQEKQDTLIGLRNFFLKKGYDKLKNQIGFSLSTLPFYEYVHENEKKEIYARTLSEQLSNQKETQLKFSNFFNMKLSKRKEENLVLNKRLY